MTEDLEILGPDDVPDNGGVLQCGIVLSGDGETLGRIDPEVVTPDGVKDVE